MWGKRQLNRNNIQKIIIITRIHRFFSFYFSFALHRHSFNSWLNVYLLKRLLYVHTVGLSFCVGFHFAKKFTKCFVLTLYDINERTSSKSYKNKKEIRIACIKKKREMQVWERWTMMWTERSDNRKKMTYLRIERKHPRESIQNQRWLCRARCNAENWRKQLRTSSADWLLLHFQLILSEMKRKLQIHNIPNPYTRIRHRELIETISVNVWTKTVFNYRGWMNSDGKILFDI